MWKLSKEQKEEVVCLYKQGKSLSFIGRRFEISRVAVRGILERRGIEIRDDTAKFRKYQLNQEAFSVASDDVFYWVGFLMADGTVVGNELAITLHEKDREQLVKLLEFLGAGHPVQDYPQHRTCRIAIRSKQLVSDLASYGVLPSKSLSTKAPTICATSRDFWRGVIDGDGSIGVYGKRPQIRLYGTYALMGQFLSFARSTCQTSATVRPHKSIYSVAVGGMGAKILASVLYEHSGVFLDRKMAKAMQVIQSPFPTGPRAGGWKVHTAKLSEDDVKEIRSLRGKVTQRELASRFGISVRSLKDVLYGKTWKWVQ